MYDVIVGGARRRWEPGVAAVTPGVNGPVRGWITASQHRSITWVGKDR